MHSLGSFCLCLLLSSAPPSRSCSPHGEVQSTGHVQFTTSSLCSELFQKPLTVLPPHIQWKPYHEWSCRQFIQLTHLLNTYDVLLGLRKPNPKYGTCENCTPEMKDTRRAWKQPLNSSCSPFLPKQLEKLELLYPRPALRTRPTLGSGGFLLLTRFVYRVPDVTLWVRKHKRPPYMARHSIGEKV